MVQYLQYLRCDIERVEVEQYRFCKNFGGCHVRLWVGRMPDNELSVCKKVVEMTNNRSSQV
jgi:hypothetical protein